MKLHKKGLFPVDKLATIYAATDFEQSLNDLKAGQVSYQGDREKIQAQYIILTDDELLRI